MGPLTYDIVRQYFIVYNKLDNNTINASACSGIVLVVTFGDNTGDNCNDTN